MLKIDTPYLFPKHKIWVFLVYSKSDLCPTCVIVVLYAISCFLTQQIVSRDTVDVFRSSFLSSSMGLLCHVRNTIMHVLLWQTIFAPALSFWFLFPSLLCNSGNKQQNNTHECMNSLPLQYIHYLLYIPHGYDSNKTNKQKQTNVFIATLNNIIACKMSSGCIHWIYICFVFPLAILFIEDSNSCGDLVPGWNVPESV